MSYMRGEYYIYSDVRGGIQFYCPEGDLFLPDAVFDALVMMRWAEMTPEERAKAAITGVERGGGNFGCDPLCKIAGDETGEQALAEMVKAIRAAKAAEAEAVR